jgi:hypothetical protein
MSKGKGNTVDAAIKDAVRNLPPGKVPAGGTREFDVKLSVEAENPNIKEFKAELVD